MRRSHLILLVIQILILIGLPIWTQGEPQPLRHAPGEILIKLQPEFDGLEAKVQANRIITGIGSLDKLSQRYQVLSMEKALFPKPGEKESGRAALLAGELGRIYLLRLAGDQDIQQAVAAFQDDPEVSYAQPNYLSRLSVVPEDSLYDEQWALAKMQMPAAWDIERGDSQVIVGMVDSGIDYDHQDLIDNIWVNPGEDLDGNGQVDSSDFNGIDDDDNGYVDDIRGWDFTDAPQFAGLGDFWERDNDPDDDLGHGTHVSGIVAAVTDNGLGVAGISWHSKLMPLRAAFRMSIGAFLEDDDVAASIVYAVDNGARVINMSWGDPHVSPVIRDVVAYAHARGCIMAAAAGNADQEGIFYPGGYDQTIAVGASTSFDQRATFSSFGRNLDVLAPGSNIYSTLPDDQYGTLGGTSMATAHVTGLVALLLSKDPTLSAEEVRGVIDASAVDLGPPGWDPEHGNGRIDGLRALKMERTPLVQISHPETGTGLHSPVAIVGTALGAYVDGYSLDYGLGLSPSSYEAILERTSSQALAETLVVWDGIDQLPDTACTIRLQVWQTEGGMVEDRVVVQVDHTPPVMDQIRAVRRLDADEYSTFVEWQTDDESLARIFYRPLGEEEFSFVDGLHVTREHSLDLTGELESGEYQFYLASTNAAGLTTVDDNGGQYYPLSNPWERVDRGGFLLLEQLPAGYLFHRPVDLDRDGQREILFMAFSDTSTYGQVMAYEMRPDGQLHMAFQSEANYLVWDVGDADGDGKTEILGGGYAQVSLFEAPDSNSYPDPLEAVWSQEGVWGSQMADTDDDGLMEILSRVDIGSDVVVFENVEDDSFSLVASLTNPTEGRNSTSTRFAVADFDGDGKQEILAGDSDGDIFIFETVGDNDYETTWSESTGLESALYLAPGDQLEGGGSWFVVAAKKSDVYEPRSTFWRLMVYQPTGDDEYDLVWSQELVGVGSQGNGVVAADFTGDGHKEIAICAMPDLYVFQRKENGEFQPIWYSSCGLMYRPFIGDLHGDGWVEIALNGPDSMVVLEPADFGEAPPPPVGVAAQALDAHRIFLEWMAVPEAASYTVHRGLKYEQLDSVQAGISTTTFLDSGLVENTTYYYAVTTVDSLGRESLFYSLVASATPNEAPQVMAAEAVTPIHVGVSFNEPMGPSAQVASHYWIDGGVGSPSSVILDRAGRRALLSLVLQLQSEVLYTVEVRDVSDVSGVPVAPDAQTATFSLVSDTLPQPLYVQRAELLSRTDLDVLFSDSVDKSSAEDTSHYRINPSLVVREAQVDSSRGDLVHLTLAAAPTRGSVYLLSVADIWNATLQRTVIPGLGDEASFFYPASDLTDAIAVPNPFSPGRDGDLEFIKVPPGARARIFTISGEPIWSSDEAGMRGTIPWSGINENGHEVASGVYLYVLEADGQIKKGKLAVLR